MVILFKAIPLESTDGERLEKSPECAHPGLCVNPYHINVSVRELDLYLANFINSHEILSGICDNNNEKDDDRGMKGYTHNPYNGVVCNDTILATGVFSSKELWRLSKASIMQGPNGMQPPVNAIKLENPSYYCNSYTPPATDHTAMMASGAYSPLSLPRSSQSPSEPRHKRPRRLSSTEDDMELGPRDKGSEVAYYGQSPASLSSQTSWHSDVDHGLPQQHSSVTSISSSSLGGGGSGSGSTSANYYQQTPTGPGPAGDHSQHSPSKYPENGHDTLSDFVTFVCQEAENTQQGSQSQPGPSRSPSKLSQYYPSSMLPPPPPPPMARPVAIIRSTGELTVTTANSPPASSTPPMGGEGSPRDSRAPGSGALSPSPPASSSAAPSEVAPTSRTVVTSPFSVRSEYAFTHIHTQPGQLFSYPSISPVGAMSGVISPTNLSMFTSPVTTPRTTPRSTPIPRWNTPFISLDEDYNMMTPLISGNGSTAEPNTGTLMDDDRYFNTVVHTSEGMDTSQGIGSGGPGSNGSHSSNSGAQTPPSRTSNPSSAPATPAKSQSS
ncbi:hypothetical protein R5R35_005602 [Gryllus longicercus]|uniref:CTF/NF-I domain-containing protein n=1 Tax=Gryllus longicercus TaxID=2509291 RepID=A0AAN9V8T7_9ORTH